MARRRRRTVVGKHCESGDVLVRDADLPDPRPGDIVVTPATGAYGYALANNYNGQPRPPVVFASGGTLDSWSGARTTTTYTTETSKSNV